MAPTPPLQAVATAPTAAVNESQPQALRDATAAASTSGYEHTPRLRARNPRAAVPVVNGVDLAHTLSGGSDKHVHEALKQCSTWDEVLGVVRTQMAGEGLSLKASVQVREGRSTEPL